MILLFKNGKYPKIETHIRMQNHLPKSNKNRIDKK